MHLSPKFGRTWRDIEAEGIKIDRKISLRLTGESSLGNLRSIGMGLNGFAKAFAELKPEIVVLLGDRFELLPAAIAALMLRIPIAHIHGGELSEGAIDDSVRHAITKLASLHFAATELYRRRIIQMGESPDRVFNFGAPGTRPALWFHPPDPVRNLSRNLGSAFKIPLPLSPIIP